MVGVRMKTAGEKRFLDAIRRGDELEREWVRGPIEPALSEGEIDARVNAALGVAFAMLGVEHPLQQPEPHDAIKKAAAALGATIESVQEVKP